jgi:hypothetical protein
MIPRLPALLPLLGLAAACAHAPPAPRTASGGPGDYFPLAIGNVWTYVDESPSLPAARRGALRTVRILSRDVDGYFHDDERGELRADAKCVHDRVRRLLCAPIEVGRTWSSVVSVASTERYEIAAVGETIDTPGGRFRGCVRVRSQNRAGPETTAVLESAYCPGVGLARIETFAVVKGAVTPQVRAVLKSYRVEGR